MTLSKFILKPLKKVQMRGARCKSKEHSAKSQERESFALRA